MNWILIIIAIVLALAIVGMFFIMAVISEVIDGRDEQNGHDNDTDDEA